MANRSGPEIGVTRGWNTARNIFFAGYCILRKKAQTFFAAISRFAFIEVYARMNTVSNLPLPGLAPELPLTTPATVATLKRKYSIAWLKDVLVSIYAYGLLLTGILFPPLGAAWHAFFGPGAQ